MRRLLALLALVALGAGLAGCGGRFDLPSEVRNRSIPSDSSYQMQATWTGMADIQDILLTQGTGTQLFLLFNHDPNHQRTDISPRGEVLAYARMKPSGPQSPIPGLGFNSLFNPVALCVGGDGLGNGANRIFVLDQGDTMLARVNPSTHLYGDTTGISTFLRGIWRYNEISDLGLYWRIREYGLLGGDTIGTFTDTSMAFVNGIAADAQGRLYVSGCVLAWVRDVQQPSRITRSYLWRVKRYVRGAGVGGPDLYVSPSGSWHQDPDWLVQEGSGVGSVADPRGIFWGPAGGGALYTADYGKNWVQKLSDQTASTGLWSTDGKTAPDPPGFLGPLDVTADLQGFVYLTDSGNQRVLRYDESGNFVQVVSVEKDAYQHQLLNPITVAADDSLVFVGDSRLGEVIRYKRRK